MSKEEQIDPSIYQYDQIYDEIKGRDKQKRDRSRSRSRQKKNKIQQRPKHSRYIGRMKQIVNNKQKDHEYAYQKKIARENQKLGINQQMVFVTQSYLKKKQEEKQAQRIRKLQQQKNQKQAPQKGSYIDFKKKILEQSTKYRK